MVKPQITEKDFQAAAARLRCDVPAIKSVAEVESKGKAFYADGFPVILFERHKFHKYSKGKFDRSHPDISNPDDGGYGAAGQHQRDRFNLAFSLDPIAAMMSCSWGRFQLMGFNYKLCGFASVGEFVDAMKQSEQAQLDAFVMFIISTGLSDELRNHKWTALAEGYNGLNQRKNNYDKKLAAAYRKFQNSAAAPAVNPATNSPSDGPSTGSGTNPIEIPAAVDTSGHNSNEPPPDNPTPGETTTTKETILQKVQRVGDQVQTITEKTTDIQNTVAPISKSSWFITIATKIGGWALLAYAFVKDNWLELVIAFALIALAVWYFSKAKDRAVLKQTAQVK